MSTPTTPKRAGAVLRECALAAGLDALGWIPVTDGLPDDELTVMVAITDSDEPVWLGWHDESGWYSVDAGPIQVTHWQPMPEGPK